MADESATAARRVRSHRNGGGRFRRREKKGGVDSISCLPDVILQHILSFIPTKFAIRTSLLSKRWRHVWCDTPSLYFDSSKLEAAWINKTLAHYTALKMMHFHLYSSRQSHVSHMDKWIEFVMSRHVENLSLKLWLDEYTLPDFFYISSSIKQLTLEYCDMIDRCSVAWTSLKNLSLLSCNLSDESMAKILSGCPILESLTLSKCDGFRFLDLSESVRLKTLVVDRNRCVKQIVAPHIHCLKLINSQLPCTVTDTSSLTEAHLDIPFNSDEIFYNIDHVLAMVLKMIEDLQHVEKLTFGGHFLQILSLVELCGVPFPMLKVKALTLETMIFRYVIPGIKRVLQNSPDLKKLTVHTSYCHNIPGEHLDKYLKGLNPAKCWRSIDGVRWNKSGRDVESKHLASFVELVLKNRKTLEKMFLPSEDVCFKEIVPTLSHNDKVSIACLLTL
ncbi:hypothetical protein EUTSA_v10027555mg, partial [Eutrema salsugineum]